jgi:hypothetical protein
METPGPGAGASPVALGWRSHSGWAVLVAVAGPAAAPVVVRRERVELLPGSLPRQPYHEAAEGDLSIDEGQDLVTEVAEAAATAACSAVTAAVAALDQAGHTARAVGLVAGDRRVPRQLVRILASHPLLHAAEGHLFEAALASGSAEAGLAVVSVARRTVFEDAAGATGMTVGDLHAALLAAGKVAGPPWQLDHREAAAAALAALAAAVPGAAV